MIVTLCEFTVIGTPVPQGSMKAFMRPGAKHPIVTSDNTKLRPWRDSIACAAIADQHKRGITELYEGAVAVTLAFVLPAPKRVLKSRLLQHHTTRPDIDKLIRACLDALTAARVWHDDSQVVFVSATKVYELQSAPPCCRIVVRGVGFEANPIARGEH
jgi:crossover junction endodeoxyribonuclease RusA